MARAKRARASLIENLLPWVASVVVLIVAICILRTVGFMGLIEAWLVFWVFYLIVCGAKPADAPPSERQPRENGP
jgi:hypothetical protein